MSAIKVRRDDTSHPRGRPLLMLGLLVVGWIAVRSALWETPFALPKIPDAVTPIFIAQNEPEPFDPSPSNRNSVITAGLDKAVFSQKPRLAIYLGDERITEGPLLWQDTVGARTAAVTPMVAAGHHAMLMAALSHMPVYGVTAAPPRLVDLGIAPWEPRQSATSPFDRWSLDTWVYWRDGSNGISQGPGRSPVYGGSQAAGLLQYRLSQQDRHDPRAYMRAYRALVENGEGEIAAGLSARPLADFLLRAHVEMRATRSGTSWEARPAAFVSSELMPIAMPAGAKAEFYFQGGYVGGDNATAFADGQAHVLKHVATFDLGELSMGAAAWGGAQKGAERLDAGPTLRLDLSIGDAPARLSTDWRQRVAGSANPDSGVAITLSTRF
ncbi:hypothetical protein AMC99_01978 [Altererythrobacter epoxidivorans]|uniref:Uncharacterized protein n=1 Tax=Altererythrobacter epoxidivorans TaxID=361183 RepID=A0A0M3TAS1_9SPHN|nr:hypothetical protein [Altererythrobacter epoxidivorans]ALE17266.1 hypothetical protein AMC99_01978 [Altererythrobacter epoxidivorans]